MKQLVFGFLILLVSGCSGTRRQANPIDPYNFEVRKNLVADKAAVVTAHPLASMVGKKIMEEGGNAFDAAIATQFALAVVYPGAGNLGGGGFMVARKSDGTLLALDYREMAPASAHRDMYLDKAGNVIKDLSVNGHLASGVPGTVAGIFETLPHARLSLKKLIQPAIDLAKKGFVLTAREASGLNGILSDLDKYNTMPSAFQDKKQWKAGDTLFQPDLAATLERIRDNGRKGFYEGRTAQLVEEEMKRGGGIITVEDMKNYQAKWRIPHQFRYRGHTIISMPLPASGGILINQMLTISEQHRLYEKGFHSPAAVQLMIEAERRAYADRAAYMGDPDYYKAPVSDLVDPGYLKERMKDFIPGKAGNSKTTIEGTIGRSEQTTHISIVDGDGNAVAVTTTLNNGYGSRTVVGGAGFLLNDEMDDFSIKPGFPNIYGAIGGEANAIVPGKRMLSSMTPTIVLKDGSLFLVTGTPGGTTIPTSVYQTLVNIIDFDLPATDAVNMPKFHHQWLPDQVDIERDFPAALKDSLVKMGYKVVERSPIGRTELIKVLPGGRLEAVADKRGDDSAAGF